MKVAPSDIRYAVIGVQKVKGIPTPGILSQGHLTRNDAHEKMPTDSRYAHLAQVIGYVSNHRREDQLHMRLMLAAHRNESE